MSYYYIEVIPEPEERNVDRNEDRKKLANFLTTFVCRQHVYKVIFVINLLK